MSTLPARFTGFAIPPAAWALTTQLGQILPYIDCTGQSSWTLLACLGAVGTSAGGAIFGLSQWRNWSDPQKAFGQSFLAIAVIFVFAICLQGALPCC
jgi:uncharacterized membrane protein